MKIGYIRVSSKEQNEKRQVEALKNITDQLYIEKISGKNTNRPKLQEMLDFVRKGDTIVVESISRFARNTKDLLDLVELLKQKNVDFQSLKENIDTHTPTGKFMLTVFGAVAELERGYIRQRQKEGIKLTLEAGEAYGRPPILSDNEIKEAYQEYKNPERIKQTKELYEGLNISKATFYRLMKEQEKKM